MAGSRPFTHARQSVTGPVPRQRDRREPRPSGPAVRRWLYADTPIGPGDADALSFGAYADALALLIDSKTTNTPLAIAIDGPWGAGKTSLAKMTEARLAIGSDWDEAHVICWFDAWANDDARHLGAAFAADVAKAANKQRHWWMRLLMPLPSAMLSPEQRWWRRLGYGLLAVVLAAVAVFWPTGASLLTPLSHAGTAVSGLGKGTAATRLAWPLIAVTVILLAQRLAASIQGVARWIDQPQSEAARGAMADANRQLGRLIRQALRKKRRLIIFVDNLERCRPPRAVEVCEVVTQLIGHPEVVTVLIGDMDTIAMSAEIKYAGLETSRRGDGCGPGAAGGATGAYGRAYLEKLIQIQLRLPPTLDPNLRKMLTSADGVPPAIPSDASDRNQGLLSANGLITAGAAESVATAALVVLGSAVILGTDLSGVGGLAVAGASVGVQRAVEGYAARRRDRIRREIDEAVRAVLEQTEGRSSRGLSREPDVTTWLEASRSSAHRARKAPGDAWEIRRRMRQFIVSPYTDLRQSLDRGMLAALPPSPRGAKRMVNHAHLLLDIGVGRGIFDNQPRLQGSHLAVWVALTERWPPVAAAITKNPALMGELEERARQPEPDSRPALVTPQGGELRIDGADSGLFTYLKHAESLVPVIGVLVNFYPDQNDAAADDEVWWKSGC